MTQEEKAKRYDKAIEKAKAIYQCKYKPDTAAIIAETLQNIFPELKESEGDKIRKAIYNCVKWFGFDSCFFKDVSQEECLSWLETQGVHANFRNKIQIGDKVTRNKDGVLVNLSQLNRVAKKDEKQGEKKPVEESWPNLSNCLHDCKKCIGKCIYRKEEYQEQKPNAWSEEDENVLNDCIKCVMVGSKSSAQNQGIISWLKSIKDRYTWKPSEEQMAQLKRYCPDNRPLTSLYEQLKKLK